MRLEQLTFTRFLAAIAVVTFHYGRGSVLMDNETLGLFFHQALYGVSYFFILSGFVMMIAYSNKEVKAKKYFVARFARIYPLYLCCLFAVVLFNIVLKNPFSFADLLAHLFTVQSWIPMHAQTLNFPDWSLSVEFFFYALFPFLINVVYKRFSLTTLTVFILAFWVLSQFLLTYAVDHWYIPDPSISCDLIHFFPLSHLNEFLLGNLVALLFLKYKENLNSTWNDVLVVASVVLLILLLKYPASFLYHNGFLAIAFVPLIIFLSGDKSKIAKIFKWKPLVFLGEISFGIYLLQLPVYLFYQSVFFYLGFTFNFYVFLVFLIAVAALSYFLIEKPCRDFINSWYAKKTAPHKSN